MGRVVMLPELGSTNFSQNLRIAWLYLQLHRSILDKKNWSLYLGLHLSCCHATLATFDQEYWRMYTMPVALFFSYVLTYLLTASIGTHDPKSSFFVMNLYSEDCLIFFIIFLFPIILCCFDWTCKLVWVQWIFLNPVFTVHFLAVLD